MSMKQKKNLYQYVMSVLCFAFLLILPKLTVQAATGSVNYGSESYQWELGTTNPIGVYVSGDEAVADYEVCLSYDDTMLRYVDGASEQVDNLLYIRGAGRDTRYKTMLYFEVLQEGDTQIQVVSVVAHTEQKPTVVSGNDVLETAAEDFQMDGAAIAPIHIFRENSTRLVELVTEPQYITDFSADVSQYTLEVPAEVEQLDVSYVPEDESATVTVSDTALQVGENIITVTVTNGEEEHVYSLHVTRQAPVELPEETGENTEPEAPTESEASSAESEEPSGEEFVTLEPAFWDAGGNLGAVDVEFLQSLVLWVVVILVAILAIAYLVYNINLRREEREWQEKPVASMKVVDMEKTVINVVNVTMKFKMAKDEASSLKEYLIRTLKKQNQYSYLTALDNVSFDVKQGEVVGIIGTNGSGKSTILKIVSGALRPTKGRVYVDRSKVQMLTLGTGFDMELTARENVYLNGSIIGYTKEYIDEKFDEIVKFAELEGFMDERMKTFSSGMVSRLGFAIATMRDTPDILILDEVLSVGDMFFREKSEKRIKEMIHSGATVLIVSHSMDTIKKNCNKVVWIEKGVLQMVGEPQKVCEAYTKMEMQK